MNKNTIATIFLILGVYIFFSGISYLAFAQGGGVPIAKKAEPAPTPKVVGQLTFDEKLPKTEACPLSGVKYSKPQKDWWSKHRPLGVMIENHQASRPQSGLSFADVVYEAVAEGSITRFLAVFYCQDAGIIGPVRSARTYFIDFMSEYGISPLYAHVGGANTSGPANAIGQLSDYDWSKYNDMNQISDQDLGFPIMVRDYNRIGHAVDTEHTMYSSTEKLWKVAKDKRKLTNVDEDGKSWDDTFVGYSFKLDATTRPESQSVHMELWEGYKEYFVDWTYDKVTNTYKRNNGGKPHIDFNNKKQLTAKNIIVLSMLETNANDGYENNAHLLYKTKGTGKAYIFMDGKQTLGTWRKSSRTARLMVFDQSGKAIEFNRGVLWFTVLPTDGILTVK